MSEALERQLREDRALRNAARALFEADLAHLRASLAGKSISSRIAERIGEGASDVLDEAMASERAVRTTIACSRPSVTCTSALPPTSASAG